MAKKAIELTQEQMEAIDNYGSRINTLKDFVTAVRTRPGQFIGPLHGAGLLNMIREIVQNSLVDQVVDPDSPCNWTSVYYNMNTLEVVVKDNGLGFPFDDMLRMITKQYTSKNYIRRKGEYPAGYNGIGMKAVNALSEYMSIESYRYDGEARKLELRKGYPVTKEAVKIPNKEKHQGSIVRFIPDEEIMGEMNLPYQKVYELISHILSLTPIGTRVDFEAIDLNGVSHVENMVNRDGIVTDLINKVKSPICKPIMIFNDDGDHKLEAALCFDMDESSLDRVSVTSFSNFCPTKEGTHIDGTIDGICRWFVKYLNTIYLSNQKSKTKITAVFNDIKSGLCLMIAAAHIEPQWTGQAKEILSNPDMEGFCRQTVINSLDEWSKNNPNDLSKLCKFFKDIAEARLKMDKEKVKIVAKYQANSLTGMPAKYVKPSKQCKELIICEGDSAAGTIKQARDTNIMGVMPIRGKIPSAFEKTKQVFWDNQETQGIAKIILGREYTRKFDVKEVKWEKIIFMCDADVDRPEFSYNYY